MRVRIETQTLLKNAPSSVTLRVTPSPLRGEGFHGALMRKGQYLRPFLSSVTTFGRATFPQGKAICSGALAKKSQAQFLSRSQFKFCTLRPPVGPEIDAPKHSWFCAPEGLCHPKGITPVMGAWAIGDFPIAGKVTRPAGRNP